VHQRGDIYLDAASRLTLVREWRLQGALSRPKRCAAVEAVESSSKGIAMNTVRAVAFICFLALGFEYAAVAMAQQGGGSAPAPPAGGAPATGSAAGSAQSGGSAAAMSADTPEDDAALNLTDDQKTQIKAIREDAKQQIQAMQKDSSLSDEAKQQKLKVIRKDIRRQVWNVMTPDQQKQWAAEQRERRENKHGGSAAPEAKPQN
jgi:Spy/CpxP family protein refolding chaperone